MIKPKISVIVPVYNVESVIEETLDCLINQTLIDDIEVLMIDDGSQDKSRYIIEKYALDYNNFHAFHKDNEGPGVARNYGLDNADGEFIYFMDSDDFLVYDALERLYDYAIEHDLEVVTCNFLRFNNHKSWQHPIGKFVYGDVGNVTNTNLYEFTNFSWDMPLWNKLYRREFLKNNNIRFFNRDVLFEDNLFSNEVFIKAENVGILNEFLYCWRKGSIGSSLTQNYYIDRGRDLYEMIMLVNDLITNDIDENEILDKKYHKLLVIDLPYFIEGINNYPKDTHDAIFEYIYKMVNLVPDKHFLNLNTYYGTLYNIVLNKDWDDLLLLIKINKRNPVIPDDLNINYKNKLDFKKDCENEQLKVIASKITFEENHIIIKFNAFINYLYGDISSCINFKIVNCEFKDQKIDSRYIDNNTLRIPLNLFNCGVNKLIADYSNGHIESSCHVFTGMRKIHNTDNFEFELCFDKQEDLKLLKREKNQVNLCINEIKVEDNKFKFKGHYNDKLNNIVLIDYLDFNEFEFPINYISDSHFLIEIDYCDFLKAPIKKWLIKSNDKYGKINLENEKKIVDDRYIINITNYGNNIMLDFEPYNAIDMINSNDKYISSLKKENMDLKEKNKQLNNRISEFKSRKIIRFADKLKKF